MEEVVIKKYCVYVHRDVTGEIFYVGHGKLDRPFQVRDYHRSQKWIDHVEEYGLCNIEIISCFDSKKDAIAEESRLTKELFDRGVKLTNIKIGDSYKNREDHPCYGLKLSDETKRKISAAHIGKTLSDETKQKLSLCKMGSKNHFYGREHSEETKKRISQANSGRTMSKEFCDAASERQLGNKSHFFKGVTIGVHTQTGKIICFDGNKSMHARGFNHSNVYAVMNGRLKTYKKFTYYRTDDRSHIQELIDQNNFYDDESGKLLNSFLNT